MPGTSRTFVIPNWLIATSGVWLRDNVMCFCYEITLMPGTIVSYVPWGTLNPDCGCVKHIPWSELKGIVYEAQRR